MNAMNAMDAIALVAERKIEEARAEGAFDNLPGMGKPLVFEDLSHLPADMRMAYTLLRNSGYLETPLEADKTPSMRDLLAPNREEAAAYGKMQRLKVLLGRVRREEARQFPERADRKDEEKEGSGEIDDSPYLGKLLDKL